MISEVVIITKYGRLLPRWLMYPGKQQVIPTSTMHDLTVIVQQRQHIDKYTVALLIGTP